MMAEDDCLRENKTQEQQHEEEEYENLSMNDMFHKAQGWIDDDDINNLKKSMMILSKLQRRIAMAAMFSKNEELEDMSTSTLELLATEFYLAKCYMSLPTKTAKERSYNLRQSIDLFHFYLKQLEDKNVLLINKNDSSSSSSSSNSTILQMYHTLLDMEEESNNNNSNNDNHRDSSSRAAGGGGGMMTMGQAREAKIARFRLEKSFSEQTKKYASYRERRRRMEVQEEDVLDGYDGETLDRNIFTTQLSTYALHSVQEIESSHREMKMLQMAIQMEEMKQLSQQHKNDNNNNGRMYDNANYAVSGDGRSRPPPSNKPLQLTHVTQHPQTGELIFKKDEFKAQVFRPGWSQPTMSLAELGDKERAEAIERGEQQKQSEAAAKLAPRRYEQLVKDGMEDNADLVDASAKLDRDWDDWKDENPRGSGNKMGDRGDRNF